MSNWKLPLTGSIALLIVVAAGTAWYLLNPVRQLGLPDTSTDFQPEHCEFHARIAGVPQIEEQLRGELSLSTAKVEYPSGTALRVSCTPFFVVDQAAFMAQLGQQLEFAARSTGIHDAQTRINASDGVTVASYWGTRGDQERGAFLRSDTYVGETSFMEVLVLAPQRLQSLVRSTAMIEVSKRAQAR